MTEHRYSVERLVHYQCGLCRGWWSIGDGPTHHELVCPWCGEEANVREMEDSGHG